MYESGKGSSILEKIVYEDFVELVFVFLLPIFMIVQINNYYLYNIYRYT